ncbi:MAG: hypothetical protein GWP59_01255, partial [Chlamydiales bacterium]|nr:hypothetical protein [Chlamydiales bacterium]
MTDDAMFELFRADLEEQLEVLSSGLLSLEEDPENADLYEALMRAAHSIKGASKVIRLDMVTDLAHVVEDCFVLAQKGSLALTSDHIDVFLEALDIFETLKEEKPDTLDSWKVKHEKEITPLHKRVKNIALGEDAPLVASSASSKPSESKVEEKVTPAPVSTPAVGTDDEFEIPLAAPLPDDEDPAENLGELGMLDLFQADLDEQVKALSEGLLNLEE